VRVALPDKKCQAIASRQPDLQFYLMTMQNIIVDAHHHFLDPTQFYYPWMSEKLAKINRCFTPDDFRLVLAERNVNKTILIQAIATAAETCEFCKIAAQTDFIAGVVGWIDLTDSHIAKKLQELKEIPGGNKLVGIRHQVNEIEPDHNWLLRADVRCGLQAISDAGLVYDFLLHPAWLPVALKTAQDFPKLNFVIDHMANPAIRDGEIKQWSAGMQALSALQNVYCKMSGMIENANWSNWKPDDLVPYVQEVMKLFGEDRLMFGSNWPVCLVAGSYNQMFDALVYALGDISAQTRAKIFGGNAIKIYQLKI
jgi:L-fuconolactonase